MDSRWRFLHPVIRELWGHRKGRRAGNGKTGTSEVAVWEANPPYERRIRDVERTKVAKLRPLAVEKSRY